MSNIHDMDEDLEDNIIVGSDCHDEGTSDILPDDATAGIPDDDDDDEGDLFLNDGEADGDALASAGMGTDETYNCFDNGE